MRLNEARQESESKRRCNICGGVFKNKNGMRMHQGKSKCKEQLQQYNVSLLVLLVSRWQTRAKRQTAPRTSLFNLLRAQEDGVNLKVWRTSKRNHSWIYHQQLIADGPNWMKIWISSWRTPLKKAPVGGSGRSHIVIAKRMLKRRQWEARYSQGKAFFGNQFQITTDLLGKSKSERLVCFEEWGQE